MVRRLATVIAVAALALVGGASPADAALPSHPPTDIDVTKGEQLSGGRAAVRFSDDVYHRAASTGGTTQTVRYVAQFADLDESDDLLVSGIEAHVDGPSCSLTVEIFNFRTRRWELRTDSAPLGPSDTAFFTTEDPLVDYVNNAGEGRLRVTCTSTDGPFVLNTDLLVLDTFS